jgi:hypothetical protein
MVRIQMPTQHQHATFANLESSFNMRKCIRYVKSGDGNLCSGCKKPSDCHEEMGSDQERWSYQACTKKVQTNAYGELIFPAAHHKKAKVCEHLLLILDVRNFFLERKL